MKYLESLEKFGINLRLERITTLLDQLGNPQQSFNSIHVAGTNGKGSTCAMIASILNAAGYRVGLYTSPHLFHYTERIKINGKEISRKEFSRLIKLMQLLAEKLELKPTVFEVLTAAAFLYFAQKKVDYAVVEVGLGGRLDATNVLTPLVSIITNIELEHTKILGNTLTKIAAEKAAIIKPHVPVVTAEIKPEPLKVIREKCEKSRSILIGVSPNQIIREPKLLGPHQKINCATAIAAIRLAGIKVDHQHIRQGLKKVSWPGRFQVIQKRPLIIVDGAHNPSGTKVLRQTIQENYPGKKFSIIFGCQQDKDQGAMLKELSPIASRFIFTRSSHPQSAKIKGEAAGGIRHAFALWDKKSPLLVCGSLFLIADFMKIA